MSIHATARGLQYARLGPALEVISAAADIPLTHVQSVYSDRQRLKIGQPLDGMVHVKWMAASINPSDINQIEGSYALKALELPAIGGNEGAGRVIKVFGSVQESIRPGNWVIPSLPGFGTWRTESICRPEDLYVIPENKLTLEQAATMQVNPPTAYQLLLGPQGGSLRVARGGVVIQNAANSAVGRCVIQIAAIHGIKTVNIVRDRDQYSDLEADLKSLGATLVIPESRFLASGSDASMCDLIRKECGDLPTLALNAVGGPSATQLARVLQASGTLVTYGGMSKKPLTLSTSMFIYNDITFLGFWMSRWYHDHSSPQDPDRKRMMDDLFGWVSSGSLRLKPVKMVNWESGWRSAIQNAYSDQKQVLLFE